MFSPDEVTQTTEELELLPQMFAPEEDIQTTEELEELPRVFDHRSVLSERRQSILQKKNSDLSQQSVTDALPPLGNETAGARVAWRQVTQLHDENRRLQFEIASVRNDLQDVLSESAQQKEHFEDEVATLQDQHQQEVKTYQRQVQELMDACAHLREINQGLDAHYQQLTTSFHDAIAASVRDKVLELAQMVEQTPETVFVQLQDVARALLSQARQEGDKHLTEALYLKHEVTQLAEKLEQERQLLEDERQKLSLMQYSLREQAVLRQKTLNARLYARWRVVSISTSLGLIVLLVVLQILCLAVFHIPFASLMAVAFLVPIAICGLLSFVFAHPIHMVHRAYMSLPRRKKVKRA